MGGLGTRTVGDPLGDGDGVLLSWSSRAQPSAVWSYTMCYRRSQYRRKPGIGRFSREPRDRIASGEATVQGRTWN